jgi:hypothetical protein
VLVTQRHWIDKLLIVSACPSPGVNIAAPPPGIMYDAGYSEMASLFHDVAGYVMMPLALGMLWVELLVLSSLFVEAPARPTRAPYSPARRSAQRPPVPRTRRAAQPKREGAAGPREPAHVPAEQAADKS